MTKKIVLFSLLALGALLLLASCKPYCATEDLMAPDLVLPTNWGMADSLTPTLQWVYPDDSCTPKGYRIDLTTAPDYTDSLAGGTGDPSTSWSPGSALQPATQYKWWVTPINDTTLGPSSPPYRFFTGPQCSGGTVVTPVILSPVEGDIVTTSSIIVKLSYSGICLPFGVRVDVTKDPTFAGIDPFIGDIPAMAWVSGDLDDCSWYYTRALATDGFTAYAISETVSFYTNFSGTCPAPDAPASVYGIVWEDICDVPSDTLPDPIPGGCVMNSWGTGVWGDGIRQPGEDGIPNVTVHLGEGLCPSTGLATALTDADGYYKFGEITPGVYCISINADENDALQKPGMWTRWMSGYEWTYSIHEIGPGDEISEDFGWYPYTVAGAKSTQVTCPEGYHYSSKTNSCVPPCEGELLWNQYYQECQPTPVCSNYSDGQSCETHPPCQWLNYGNGFSCQRPR